MASRFDLIFGYLLELHQVTYCGSYLAVHCVSESPSSLQALEYAEKDRLGGSTAPQHSLKGGCLWLPG